MKNNRIQLMLLALLVLFIGKNFAHSQVIVLDGIYQEKDVFVQNPFSASQVGFCIKEVRVNGNITTDEINSNAFAIDLTLFQLAEGDDVKIEIKHKEGCVPKVINPEVVIPKSTCKYHDLNLNEQGLLSWTATGEKGALDFVIEQFRWNKWMNIGEVRGEGTTSKNKYSFPVELHSGMNKVRVLQKNVLDGTQNISENITYENNIAPLTLESEKVKMKISFDRNTRFEIFDAYGDIKKMGFSKEIDVCELKSGKYFINFDNKIETFIKK